MERLKQGVAAVAAALLCFVALKLSSIGFQHVLDFRTLERIPLTSILGSAGGESQLQGWVESSDDPLSSPYTHTKSVYYRYLIEEEYRDSDGDRHWRTIKDQTQAIDFTIADNSGLAAIRAQESQRNIRWSVKQSFRTTVGKRRYTEWRIEPGHKLTVFGWLHINDDLPEMSFSQAGEYLPIISSFNSSTERKDLSQWAIFYLWLGVSATVLMCLALIFLFKWHRVLVFLGLITVTSSSLLISYGFKSLESDVEAGFRRVESQRERTENLITQMLNKYNIRFPGWSYPFDLNSSDYLSIPELDRRKINRWRNTAYQVRTRYMQQISGFPEKPYAVVRGKAEPPLILLPPDQQAQAEEEYKRYETTRVSRQTFLTCIALLITVALAWVAFRLIRVKRMQENLPTSKTAGVVFGLTELKGKLIPESREDCFTGPVSHKACVWYQYIIEEKRGSGKKARWVKIFEETKKQPFYCEDEEGRLRVFPSKAEVITKHTSKDYVSRKRYTEKRLEPGDQLYLLGKAKPDKTTGDSLVLSYDKDSPYIVANRTEAYVMFLKASQAMFLLSLGVSLLFGAGLWIGGSNGDFSSLNFLTASLIAPFFLTVLITILMYNDLIFLSQRCERSWANIQVSLKKRAELIPRLEKVVKRYLLHEADLQEELAELRNSIRQTQDTKSVDGYMARESKAIDQLLMVLEAYPDLKGNEVVSDFNKRLIKLENEIALIRAGFNNSVMNYNTRVQTFPDNLLSKLFNFKKLSALTFEKAAHAVPRVGFEK